jgi:hypothetical protein
MMFLIKTVLFFAGLISLSFNVCAQNIVKVSNEIELYNAIGSNKTIVLAAGDYHLEKIDSLQKNDNCNWAMVLFDEIYENETQEKDKTLLIQNIQNLTIKAASNRNKDSVRILTNRTAASVLAFKNCKGILLEGIIFGHDLGKNVDNYGSYVSYCSGEVLEFMDCNNVILKDNILFGCGTRGFLAHRCKTFNVISTIIKDCTFGLFGVFESENVLLNKCAFYYTRFQKLIEISNCKDLFVKKTVIHNALFSEFSDNEVVIENSENIMLNEIKIKKISSKEFFKMGDEYEKRRP